MYQNYRAVTPCSRPSSAASGTGRDKRPGSAAVGQKIFRCWREIEAQCEAYDKRKSSVSKKASRQQGWRTVRLFVSSTFTDFHSEREILVKKVFPALREWCEARRLALMECDLRWGVPRDSTSVDTITTCMEELDRCHQENEGEPFFLNLLGERYGWIPDLDEIPEDIQTRFKWVKGVSITHMEILHGAFRSRNPNAVFFFRDPASLDDLPQRCIKRFIDLDPIASQQTRILKQKLRERFPRQVHEYTAKIGDADVSAERMRVKLVQLDDFAENVLQFFKSAIEKKYPHQEDIKSLTAEQQEQETHHTMMQTKAEFVQGRDAELEMLLDFAASGSDPDLPLLTVEAAEDTDKWEESEESHREALDKHGLLVSDLRILCVAAPSGYGKSALLAKAAKILHQEGMKVVYHCVGCTATSMRNDNIRDRIIQGMGKQTGGDEPENALNIAIDDFRDSRKKVVFIIDGLNEVAEAKSHLEWLPARFPRNAPCIISVNTDSHQTMHSLRYTVKPFLLDLSDLDLSARRSIANHYFSKFSKKLDKEQLSMLIEHQGASVPLWLGLACAELRVYGDFRTLTEKISRLPGDLHGLLKVILNRLLREDETGCMEKLLRLVHCSVGGLPESEARKLLGDLEDGEELSMLDWATVHRYVKPFLRSVVFWYNGTLRMQFFHSSVGQVVEEQLFHENNEDKQKCHLFLANYYDKHCSDMAFTVDDLPYHLQAAGCKDRLKDFYRKDKRSTHSPKFQRQQYMNKLRCRKMTFSHPGHSQPVALCNNCATFGGKLNPLPFKTSDCCFVCGVYNVGMHRKKALLCNAHKKHHDFCYFCNTPAKYKPPVSSAYLCFWCSSGMNGQFCAHLETK